ncbi:MAG: hypothetical protein JWM69_360, partial [Candidatus Binatus sp.]|nr:hypothetical protein [Candidatus Binatus sp.]
AGFYGCRLLVTIIISYYGGNIVWIWWSLLADYVVRCIVKAHRFKAGHWMRIQV